MDDKECTTGTGRTRQQKPLSSSKYLLFLAHHLPSLREQVMEWYHTILCHSDQVQMEASTTRVVLNYKINCLKYLV